MIAHHSIEQVKQRAEVSEVVGTYVTLKKVGANLVACCPFHNEKSPSLNVSKQKQIYKCFGCGVSGDSIDFVMRFKKMEYIDAIKELADFYKIQLDEEKPEQKRVYLKPTQSITALIPEFVKYFEKRGISKATLDALKVTQCNEWMPKAKNNVNAICFNYFRGGELVNIKYRAKDKDFKLSKDAEIIFYNIDSLCNDKDYAIITEGEIDCLSLYEAGFTNVVSVPNGAAKGNLKLEYLDTCWSYFKNKEFIFLLTDNDEAGNILQGELVRRFGYDKCRKINYPPDCKDANDILVKHGIAKLQEVIKDAKEFPIEGILEIEDFYRDIHNYFYNGYPSGIQIGIRGLDDHLKLMLGQLTTLTGIPGSGKSEFVDWVMAETARNHDWNWAACSFENQPSSLHATKLMEKASGKAFSHRINPYAQMSGAEFDASINFVGNHFYFININKIDVTLDGILAKTKELVLRKGIKGLLIDPWNYIEHKSAPGQTETQYISECLTKIKAFALTHNIHIILIAHPYKMAKVGEKYEVPTLYSISGSAHFFNKTDNGITIYRDFQTGIVDVYIQKVRYSWLGKVGRVSFNYNIDTRQYKLLEQPFNPNDWKD